MCLVQTVKNSPILTKLPTYIPWNFLKIWADENIQTKQIAWKVLQRAIECTFYFEICYSRLALKNK